jgi:predicted CXXCH cytochrome family protein
MLGERLRVRNPTNLSRIAALPAGPLGIRLVMGVGMRTFTTLFLTAIVSALLALGGQTSPAASGTQEPDTSNFAWADACEDCHKDIHDAWEKTKHARALNRLSDSEQKQECVGCHLTGPKTPVKSGSTVVNAGVQCESCHGAAAAHVKDPAVKTGLVKEPGEQVCLECHNDRSPHFRGFVYAGMSRLSHRVVK